MTRSPTPDRVRPTPCPPGTKSINGRLTADSPPVRSRRRTHPHPPRSRPVLARPVTGPAAVPMRLCFSRSVEMPPPRVARHARPTASGGGGISALTPAETPARRPTRTEQVAQVIR